MKRPSLQELIFQRTIPNPKQNDPANFYMHVQRNLVPEVRLEVQTFYGSLDCAEAQYPGLDYSFLPHRRRLARHQWHRRLFRVFDELRLTPSEILSICQWEGTRSAKERYEIETGRKIRDTTADGVEAAPTGQGPRAICYWNETLSDDGMIPTVESIAQLGALSAELVAEQSDEDEDDIAASFGVQLNQQLQAAVEARSRGNQVSVDSQWEQWMKEAMERNEFDRDSILQAIREGNTFPPSTSNGTTRPQVLTLADVADMATVRSSTTASTIASDPHISRNYNDLRNMLRTVQTANNQLSAENAAIATYLSRTQTETAR